MHICPAPACEAKVPDDMLACRKDWYRLPQGIRNRVWAAWRDGEGAGSDEHNDALNEAIGWYRDHA